MVITRSNGKPAIIEDVLYVPGMKCNLFTVDKLIDKGLLVSMKNEYLSCLIQQTSWFWGLLCQRVGRTFKTLINSIEVQHLQVVIKNKQSWLWHLRFDHLTFISLNQLVAQDMVLGIPKFSMLKKLCEGWLVGKQSRNSFKSYFHMGSTSIIEVVHSNVCVYFEDHTIGGNKYFVSSVDEHSRKIWVYLIKHKDEVFEVFKIFNLIV